MVIFILPVDYIYRTAAQEQQQKQTNSTKKMKEKNAPKRGLGIAKLEEIIMEEEKERRLVSLSPNHRDITSSSSSLAPLQQSSPSHDLPSPISMIRQATIPPPNFGTMNMAYGQMGYSAIPVCPDHVVGGGNWPKVCSNDEFAGLGHRHHHPNNRHGFSYRSYMDLPISNGLQKSQRFREQFSPSSSMLNNNHSEADLVLTLAPPGAAAADANANFPRFKGDEGSVDEQSPKLSMQPRLLSFFPEAKNQIGEVAHSSHNPSGDIGEKVDLRLKL
ncbi:OLC1v1008240C1 [Oldenlandia corymbosa var. corymbosa]|uniref:OLC1v1008240C1 n=1 Tax=Oldenlandia corymbosa var. corymbosa TaxID=529605 RepID=A0AAV1DL25_OLDCO|nr:OLC1v1008240C1 [Oldenlandia corymbosa var. corymbosa]